MRRDVLMLSGAAIIAISIGVVAFFSGYGNFSTSSSAVATNESAVAVPFTPVAEGVQTSFSTRVNYLITSPSELNELWKMIKSAVAPPAVDFATHSVIAVFVPKERASTITVAKIEDTNARSVSISLSASCASGGQTGALYEIVVVSATALPLTHTDAWEPATCPK